MLDEAEGKPWFDTVKGSDSMVGYAAGGSMPLWVARLMLWWMNRGDEAFVDRLYDPVPVVASLDVPSLWIFGGQDSSMPTEDSIDELEALRETGRPIEIEVFPDAEHGILSFEGNDPADRRLIGYAPGYLELQVQWLREQSGLEKGRSENGNPQELTFRASTPFFLRRPPSQPINRIRVRSADAMDHGLGDGEI
jgi:acetyl esterase/lipase